MKIIKSDILRKTFDGEKRFVNYKIVLKAGKKTKIPYYAKNKPASSTDEKTWLTYDEAMMNLDNGSNGFDGYGIIFKPDQKLVGIDIDHCMKDGKIEHEQKKVIERLIKEADTYTEISPSKEGLHLFLLIDDEGGLDTTIHKKAPYEVYTQGRYFTVTENSYGEPKPVRVVSKSEAVAILNIIGMVNKEDVPTKELLTDYKSLFSDDQILARMFGSKNGDDIKKMYMGDLSDYKNDESSADSALVHHLAFWTRKDAEQMERIWLASPLAQRKKTQSRKDYRDRTVQHAIENCKDVYEPVFLKRGLEDLDLLFTTDSKGNRLYLKNTENMARLLRHHADFTGRFRYDFFKNIFEIKEGEVWRTLEDSDTTKVQTRISVLFPETFGNISEDIIYKTIVLVSKENQIDSASDFVKSIKWDGVPRVDTWLCKAYGVEDNLYHQAVGSNWLKGLVKRIVIPACKFDYVLVLEGEQGIKKSTSLMALGGEWYLETAMSTENKDFFMQFQGKAIIEFSEGETLSRTEVKRMKAIITMQTDKYRPAYGRLSVDFPRRCVFAMTTNQEEYLKDETGNRRWLPVACKQVADVDWILANREQLFAEAYKRVIIDNEKIWEFPDEETKKEQEARRIKDANDETIVDWYWNKLTADERARGITITQAHSDALNGSMSFGKSMNKFQEMSIANILRNTLHLTKKRKELNGAKITKWYNEVEKSMMDELGDDIKAKAEEMFTNDDDDWRTDEERKKNPIKRTPAF